MVGEKRKNKQTTFRKEGRGKNCLRAVRQLMLMKKEWAVLLNIKTTPCTRTS